MGAFIAQSGRRYHPVFDKFGPEHVSQFMKNSHERDTATRRQLSTNRNYAFAYFVVIVGIFIFLAVFLLPEIRSSLSKFWRRLVTLLWEALADTGYTGIYRKTVIDGLESWQLNRLWSVRSMFSGLGSFEFSRVTRVWCVAWTRIMNRIKLRKNSL